MQLRSRTRLLQPTYEPPSAAYWSESEDSKDFIISMNRVCSSIGHDAGKDKLMTQIKLFLSQAAALQAIAQTQHELETPIARAEGEAAQPPAANDQPSSDLVTRGRKKRKPQRRPFGLPGEELINRVFSVADTLTDKQARAVGVQCGMSIKAVQQHLTRLRTSMRGSLQRIMAKLSRMNDGAHHQTGTMNVMVQSDPMDYMPQEKKPGSKTARQQAAQLKQLSALLNEDGSINSSAPGISNFSKMMQDAITWEVKERQLAALHASPLATVRQLINGRMVETMGFWVVEGEQDKQVSFVKNVLRTALRMPLPRELLEGSKLLACTGTATRSKSGRIASAARRALVIWQTNHEGLTLPLSVQRVIAAASGPSIPSRVTQLMKSGPRSPTAANPCSPQRLGRAGYMRDTGLRQLARAGSVGSYAAPADPPLAPRPSAEERAAALAVPLGKQGAALAKRIITPITRPPISTHTSSKPTSADDIRKQRLKAQAREAYARSVAGQAAGAQAGAAAAALPPLPTQAQQPQQRPQQQKQNGAATSARANATALLAAAGMKRPAARSVGAAGMMGPPPKRAAGPTSAAANGASAGAGAGPAESLAARPGAAMTQEADTGAVSAPAAGTLKVKEEPGTGAETSAAGRSQAACVERTAKAGLVRASSLPIAAGGVDESDGLEEEDREIWYKMLRDKKRRQEVVAAAQRGTADLALQREMIDTVLQERDTKEVRLAQARQAARWEVAPRALAALHAALHWYTPFPLNWESWQTSPPGELSTEAAPDKRARKPLSKTRPSARPAPPTPTEAPSWEREQTTTSSRAPKTLLWEPADAAEAATQNVKLWDAGIRSPFIVFPPPGVGAAEPPRSAPVAAAPASNNLAPRAPLHASALHTRAVAPAQPTRSQHSSSHPALPSGKPSQPHAVQQQQQLAQSQPTRAPSPTHAAPADVQITSDLAGQLLASLRHQQAQAAAQRDSLALPLPSTRPLAPAASCTSNISHQESSAEQPHAQDNGVAPVYHPPHVAPAPSQASIYHPPTPPSTTATPPPATTYQLQPTVTAPQLPASYQQHQPVTGMRLPVTFYMASAQPGSQPPTTYHVLPSVQPTPTTYPPSQHQQQNPEPIQQQPQQTPAWQQQAPTVWHQPVVQQHTASTWQQQPQLQQQHHQHVTDHQHRQQQPIIVHYPQTPTWQQPPQQQQQWQVLPPPPQAHANGHMHHPHSNTPPTYTHHPVPSHGSHTYVTHLEPVSAAHPQPAPQQSLFHPQAMVHQHSQSLMLQTLQPAHTAPQPTMASPHAQSIMQPSQQSHGSPLWPPVAAIPEPPQQEAIPQQSLFGGGGELPQYDYPLHNR